MTIDSMYELFLHDLKSIYYIEQELLVELEEMAMAATDDDLVEAIEQHQDETEEHVDRVERVFRAIREDFETHEPGSFQGLTSDLKHLKKDITDKELANLAFRSTGIKVERLEISVYENLLTLAEELELAGDIVRLIETNLENEKEALSTLKALETDSTLKKLMHTFGM